jgi:thiamine pyrophosphate-dependent acetolactate synthase large subunit-like protein
MKTFQGLTTTLFHEGLDTMFGIMGDSNMHYIAHYVDTLGGRYIGTAHEATAMSMADGYWRSSGRLATTSVTHGPGFTNILTPLVEAVRNRSSVIVVTGDTPRDRTYGQNIDIPGVIAPTGAGYEPVYHSGTVVFDVRRAVQRARVERRPIVINLPSDLMNGNTAETIEDRPSLIAAPMLAADDDALDRALGVIASAARPLVLAGQGAALAGARAELDALAEMLGAPVATSLMGLDFFRGHPLNVGVCGNLSSDIAIEVISAADCIVAFGASLNRFTAAEGDLFRGKRIVQCVLEPDAVGLYTTPDAVVLGDARHTAQCFVDALRGAGIKVSNWGHRFAERITASDITTEYVDRSGRETVDPRTAIARLDALLPESRQYVSDLGRFFKVWKYLHGSGRSSFTHTAHFGSIGLGLGTGMGVAIGAPDRLTVVLTGDGGFMQYAAELSTATRAGIPLLVLVLNDEAYGMEYGKLADFGDDPRLCLSDWPDFVTFGQAVGAHAMVVREIADLDRVAKLAGDLSGPCLVDIRLDPTVDILA